MTEGSPTDDATTAAMPWGGRFGARPDESMIEFTNSIEADGAIWPDDLVGSAAHAAALAAAGIITEEEAVEIREGLASIATELSAGDFRFEPTDEDIHMAVERRLTELIGEAGAKLHSGRSRNDQVALDMRLYAIRAGRSTSAALLGLARVLLDRAVAAGEQLAPGYTHLQRAQPVLLAHHLCAHVWPLLRDAERFSDAGRRAAISPLGAGALSGSTLGIDPRGAASEMKLRGAFENSIDAVSDRDFVAEHVFVAAMAQVHLSRLCEEIVLWASDEFDFIELADAWATGSSMMPQKKNPDVAEVVRGRAGAAIGNLVNVLTTLKGLPLAYNRDLQETKAPLAESLDQLAASAGALTGLVSTLDFNRSNLDAAANSGYGTATDLAEALVRAGVPFRRAHSQVGELVKRLEADGRSLADASNEEIDSLDPLLDGFAASSLTAAAGVSARTASGMTGPDQVREQIQLGFERCAEIEKWVLEP